jgi:hypothetical protein
VLQRFAGGAALDEFAQAVGFRRRQHAPEIEIQLHARELELMREEQLGVEARRLDALFAEEIRAFLNRFENGHEYFLIGKLAREPGDQGDAEAQADRPCGIMLKRQRQRLFFRRRPQGKN